MQNTFSMSITSLRLTQEASTCQDDRAARLGCRLVQESLQVGGVLERHHACPLVAVEAEQAARHCSLAIARTSRQHDTAMLLQAVSLTTYTEQCSYRIPRKKFQNLPMTFP